MCSKEQKFKSLDGVEVDLHCFEVFFTKSEFYKDSLKRESVNR